jgi:lipid-binding SYLF domain-containing protein
MGRMSIVLAGLLATAPLVSAEDASFKEPLEDRLRSCGEVVRQMTSVAEGIPLDLLNKAECVIVIPGVKKAALGFGGRLGWGAASCRTGRDHDGPWSAPLMMSLKGGSFGLQIGGQSSDFVLLVMDPRGIDHLLGSKFTLGADASIAAGPIGRNAEAATDITLHTEILSYSRSRGVFAGLSLEGASLAQDQKGNRNVYGHRVAARELLLESRTRILPAARGLVDALEDLSPRRGAGTER